MTAGMFAAIYSVENTYRSDECTDRAIQTQHYDHQEEDDGKEGGGGHVGDGLSVDDEQETGT